MESGKLTCRLTILRPGAVTDDGMQSRPGAPAALTQRPWAMRRDQSDGEALRSGMILGTKLSRFTLKRTAFTASLRVTDLIQAAGMTFDIAGIKEVADHDIEITAIARVDAVGG